MNHSDKRKRLQQRDSSLDMLRILAFFSVVAVHFFMHTGFYDTVVTGERMYVMSVLRTFFMNCVPMFLMLTGYLMNKKKLSGKFYMGILHTLNVYVLAGIVSLLVLPEFDGIDWKGVIRYFLGFEGHYTWYIEMYLGLFLLIPFLNLAYHGLETKRKKQVLLLTVLILTALPSVFNLEVKRVPEWWINIYPISYYFLGAYLSEYRPKIRNRALIPLSVVYFILNGSYNFYRSYGETFKRDLWVNYMSLTNVITTVLLFLIFKNINTEKWNVNVKAVLKYVAGLTLGGYLLSYIFDSAYYPVLIEKVPVMVHRLEYMPVIVGAIVVSTLLLSAVITFLGDLMLKAEKKLSS